MYDCRLYRLGQRSRSFRLALEKCAFQSACARLTFRFTGAKTKELLCNVAVCVHLAFL